MNLSNETNDGEESSGQQSSSKPETVRKTFIPKPAAVISGELENLAPRDYAHLHQAIKRLEEQVDTQKRKTRKFREKLNLFMPQVATKADLLEMATDIGRMATDLGHMAADARELRDEFDEEKQRMGEDYLSLLFDIQKLQTVSEAEASKLEVLQADMVLCNLAVEDNRKKQQLRNGVETALRDEQFKQQQNENEKINKRLAAMEQRCEAGGPQEPRPL